MPEPSKLLTVPEIGERLGRSPQAIRWQIHTGSLKPTAIVGGRRVMRASDLEAWIDAQFEQEAV